MVPMTINALKDVQRDLGLGHVHLCHLSQESFSLAHTDAERASWEPLESCELYRWLCQCDKPPAELGVYVVVPHEVDAYSEPYPVAQWDFELVTSFIVQRQEK